MSIERIDTEIEAMGKIASALSDLDGEAIGRILRWAAERYKSDLFLQRERVEEDLTGPIESGEPSGFQDVAELFSSASPSKDVDKALVVGYWLQVYKGQKDFDTQKVNTELKHLGYGVTNITRAFDLLKVKKPALVVQIKKAGTTRQARKRFKLTSEGLKAVKGMVEEI